MGAARSGGLGGRASSFRGWFFFADPADEIPGRAFQSAIRSIFIFNAVFQHIELQRPDRSQQRDPDSGVGQVVVLRHSFLEQLVQSIAKAFKFGGTAIVQESEAFRRKSRHFVERNSRVFRERIADQKIIVAHQADHVSGPRFVDRFPFPGKQPLGISQSNFLPVRVLVTAMSRANSPETIRRYDT